MTNTMRTSTIQTIYMSNSYLKRILTHKKTQELEKWDIRYVHMKGQLNREKQRNLIYYFFNLV